MIYYSNLIIFSITFLFHILVDNKWKILDFFFPYYFFKLNGLVRFKEFFLKFFFKKELIKKIEVFVLHKSKL